MSSESQAALGSASPAALGSEPHGGGPRAPRRPEPRWLDAHEHAAWLALVGVLLKLPAALDAQLRRDADMSHFEYQVLAGLSQAPEHTLHMSDLALFAGGSLSRLSHVVSRLEQRGWVRREPCPGDGRYTNAVLTAAGWDAIVASAPGHVARVRSLIFDALAAGQVAQLHELAHIILARIEASAENT